jgi:hypothetical protein
MPNDHDQSAGATKGGTEAVTPDEQAEVALPAKVDVPSTGNERIATTPTTTTTAPLDKSESIPPAIMVLGLFILGLVAYIREVAPALQLDTTWTVITTIAIILISGLIALPFIAQKTPKARIASPHGIILLVLFVLGLFTYVRAVAPALQMTTMWTVITTIAIVLVAGLITLRFLANKKPQARIASNTVNVLVMVLIFLAPALVLASPHRSLLFKVTILVYLSSLPAALYLIFIASKGRSLWEEYVINLWRLRVDAPENLPMPPPASTWHSKWRELHPNWDGERIRVEAPRTGRMYQEKFEGVFGPLQYDGDSVKITGLVREALVPVVLATIVITFGWLLVMQPESVFNVEFMLDPSDSPGAPLKSIKFGFLGAYFYVIQMLVRRFFQNDLKTAAYVHSTLRILMVCLLVWAVEMACDGMPGGGPDADARAALAFVIGVFPQVAWQVLTTFLKKTFRRVVPSLEQEYPLSDLDGMNIWYQSRLLEEGIEDQQNLATAALVDVMLNTRVPVERLVDWIDQSLLILHLGRGVTERRELSKSPSKQNGSKTAAQSRVRTLRGYGIRTATDLQEVMGTWPSEPGHNGGADSSASGPQTPPHGSGLSCVDTLGAFRGKMSRLFVDASEDPSVIQSVLHALRHAPNLVHVQAWKLSGAVPERMASLSQPSGT